MGHSLQGKIAAMTKVAIIPRAIQSISLASSTRMAFIVLLCMGWSAQAYALPWLKVSKNHRYLVTENNRPFFYLADTAWELFGKLDRADADYYLRNRAGKGFTAVQACILPEMNGLTTPNAEGNVPLVGLDPDKPNEAYFQLVDHDVQVANQDGIYMALLPTWGAWVDGKPHRLFAGHKIFNVQNAYRYGLFLGSRYHDNPNIIWVLGGDRSPEGHMDIWNAMAKGLRAGDEGRHLITYHPRGQETSSTSLDHSSWLDFNMVQVGYYRKDGQDAEAITHDYNLKPAKPVVDGETTYEGGEIAATTANPKFAAYDVRKAAYWSVFAGAMGFTYGNNSIWRFYRTEGPHFYASPGVEWSDALDSKGSFQMRHLRALMLSRPYLTRIPDQSLALPSGTYPTNPIGHDSDRIQITRDGTPGHSDATYIFAYLPIQKRIVLDTRVIAGKFLRAWWYDPRTGCAFPLGTFPNTGRFSPRGNNMVRDQLPRNSQGGPDWVLVLDDASKGYAPPGQLIPANLSEPVIAKASSNADTSKNPDSLSSLLGR